MNAIGSAATIRSKKACVVYDAETGRVWHVHRVVTFDGGREPSDAEVAADALRALRSLHAGLGALETLRVDHDELKPGKRYRVDVDKKTLLQS